MKLGTVVLAIVVSGTGCVATGSRAPVFIHPSPARGGAAGAEVRALLDRPAIGLDGLLRIADLASPAVAVARADAGAAAGRAWQAAILPNPTLDLEAEDVPAGRLGFGRGADSAALIQPLVLGGRRGAAVAAAGAEMEARRLAAQARLLLVQGEVRAVHADLIYLAEAGRVYAELIEVATETLDTARKRVEARAAPEAEAIKAEVEVRLVELGARRLVRDRAAALEYLRSLLGGVEVQSERIAGDLAADPPPVADLVRLRDRVLTTHPSLMAARKDAEAADRRAGEAAAARVPDLDLRLSMGRDFAGDADFVEAGIGLPLPLFDRNQGRIHEARFAAERARREADVLARQLAAALAEAHGAYTDALDRAITLRSDVLPGAERAYGQTAAGYKAGRTGFLDFLDAQRTLRETRLDYLASLRDLHLAHARLWGLAGAVVEDIH